MFSLFSRLIWKRKDVEENAMSDNNTPNKRLKCVEGKPMSANNAPQIKYDVFVSFRGQDVRHGFLSHLTEAFDMKKINAFVDDKLEKGDEIWPSLVEAIEGSSISLIIFSPDYASSHWCLKEAVKIFECKEKYGQIVMPVFYHVQPTDVRHQSESYKIAFAEHERKYRTEVQNWRHALNKSADLAGIESSKFQNDAAVVKEIVKLLLKRLGKPHVITNGLVEKITTVETLIRKESEESDYIGEALKNGKGIEANRSITIDMQNIKKQKLSRHIFATMSSLQFLEVSGEYNHDLFDQLCILAEGLQFLITELRSLYWCHYPLKSLPKKFSARQLVILNLQESEIEKLWDGVKDVANLKQVNLTGSTKLKELPDLSKAINLEELILKGCISLTSVHPSIFSLPKLEKLDLHWCTSLTILASDFPLCSLDYLNIDCCMNLSKFSLISESMKELRLMKTDVKTLPSSITNLTQLLHISVCSCSNLQTITKLPLSLETLNASDCISLKTLLSFPSTVAEQLKENRKQILLWNCLNLEEHTLADIGLNAQINIMKYANHHLSTPNHNHSQNYNDYDLNFRAYQWLYGYPGKSVPEWFKYKTRKDYLVIDLTSASPFPFLAFIFCFIIGNYRNMAIVRFEVYITITDGENEGKKESIKTYIDYSVEEVKSDQVCVMYDQRCSHFLNSIAKKKKRFDMQVTLEALVFGEEKGLYYAEVQKTLKGFGVSTINSSTYNSFIQQKELCDSDANSSL